MNKTLKLTLGLQDYLLAAFNYESGNIATGILETTFKENELGLKERIVLDGDLVLQSFCFDDQVKWILFLNRWSSNPSIREYYIKSSPSEIGPRYRFDDTLGNFKRVFDINCLDPVPGKVAYELTADLDDSFDERLHEFMLFQQEHVAEHDLYILTDFITSPKEITQNLYVGIEIQYDSSVMGLG